MLKKVLTVGLLAMIGNANLTAAATDKLQQTLYYGGDIITMEGDKPEYVEALIERDGKIIYAGDKASAVNNFAGKTIKVDLKGKTMMPGFIEPHLHPLIAAILLSGDIVAPHDWNVPDGIKKGVEGHDAYIARLKQSIAKYGKKDDVLFVWGYHPLWHGEMSRKILNEISPDIPVAVLHRSFHEVFLNDAAIKLMKIKEEDYKGNPQVEWSKGHFFEGGWQALGPKIAPFMLNPVKYKKGLADMRKLIEKNGITTIDEPGFPNVDFDMEYNLLKSEMDKKPAYEIYNILNAGSLTAVKGSLEKATKFMEETPAKYNTDNIKILPKQVKLFADGAIYSLAMQMKDGYTDGFKGQWMTPLKIFKEQMNYYWDRGYKIHIHANGDLGIQRCIDTVREMQKRNPRKDHRLTLHHLGYFTADQADEMKELGIEASVNPYYLWALSEKYSKYGLGPKRAKNLVPMKLLKDRDIPFSFHSDFAMAPAEPLTLVWTAVNRVTDKGTPVSQDQRIDIFIAMQAITINAARTLNLENKIGSIKTGKTANFTLLNENPFKVKKMHIKDIEVAGVVFRGDLKMRKPKLIGGDKDAHGCIGTAGFKWCAKTNKCERPWELAKEKKFENTAEAFNGFCQNK
ncbi:amidohydrolase [Sulfurovum sp. NBC37-1]|uniref:amidohydrolase n=1 Tax=Sulfurovum sp. (strain NBC37-1) TaxID=387093 RepID=UPI0001587DBC|nr:amidohydrolase [Sulfurovum sp. NBC37-1]BAF73390.1 metal-dependent hydrolase [Sulfurovum sp. NBC37-1]